MKNLVRCLGIAALAAAVVLTMTACGPDDPETAPSGPVHIWDEYGPYTNYNLEGVYVQKAEEGDADYIKVAYIWISADKEAYIKGQWPFDNYTQFAQNIITTGVTGDQGEFFKPTTAGSYTVAVANDTNGAWTTFKSGSSTTASMPELTFADKPIEITGAAPAGIKDFFGKWETTVQFQPKDSNGNVWKKPGTNIDEPMRGENIDFTYRRFDLQSTYEGNDSYPGSKGDDMDAANEYVTFYVKDWTEKTNISTFPTGYTIGYRLTVETLGFKGYSSYKSFDVFYNPNGANSTILMKRTTNNGASVIDREYKRLQVLP